MHQMPDIFGKRKLDALWINITITAPIPFAVISVISTIDSWEIVKFGPSTNDSPRKQWHRGSIVRWTEGTPVQCIFVWLPIYHVHCTALEWAYGFTCIPNASNKQEEKSNYKWSEWEQKGEMLKNSICTQKYQRSVS